MKKLTAFLLLAAVITLTSCAPESGTDISELPISEYTNFAKEIAVKVTTKDIANSVEIVSVMLTNLGDLDYNFGEEFALEVLDGKDWRSMSKKETASFDAIGYLLPQGGIITFTGRIQDCYGKLSANNTYRIVKTLTANIGTVNISAEFSVK